MRAVDYVDLGHYLRDVRESLNVTIEQAAQALHIRPRYLSDLEIGNLDSMPGKAYVRGYIKNYAEYLQLDAKEVLEEYEKLFERHVQKFFVPRTGLYSNMPTAKVLWICTAGLLALYAFWYIIMYNRPAVEDTSTMAVSESSLEPEKMKDVWEKCLDNWMPACFFELRMKEEMSMQAYPLVPTDIKVPPSEPAAGESKPKENPEDKGDEEDD